MREFAWSLGLPAYWQLRSVLLVAAADRKRRLRPTRRRFEALRRMAPGLAKRDLLYLSDDGDGDVYVYSFPDAKLQGTRAGLSTPAG